MLMVKLQCLKSQTPCCEWEEYPSPPHHPHPLTTLPLTTLSPSPPSPPHTLSPSHPLPLTTLSPSPPSTHHHPLPLTTSPLSPPSPPSTHHHPLPLTTLSTLTTLYPSPPSLLLTEYLVKQCSAHGTSIVKSNYTCTLQ